MRELKGNVRMERVANTTGHWLPFCRLLGAS